MDAVGGTQQEKAPLAISRQQHILDEKRYLEIAVLIFSSMMYIRLIDRGLQGPFCATILRTAQGLTCFFPRTQVPV